MQHHEQKTHFPIVFFRNLSCEEELPWNGGTTLLNYISSAKFGGLTGPVSFAESKRTNFKLDLLKLKVAFALSNWVIISKRKWNLMMKCFQDDAMTKVGEWTPLGGLNITDKYAFLQGKLCR